MSTSTFRRARRKAATTTARDEERGDRVAGREAQCGGHQTRENGERPHEVAPEVERVREECVALVETCAAQRDHRPRAVDHEHERDRGERPAGGIDVDLDDVRQAEDRDDRDEHADRDEEGGLGKRGEVLRLRVAVRVATISGTHRDGHGEERQERRGEVGPRVRRLREEAEARAGEAGDELDRNEEAGGPDGDERGAPLRRHG